MATDPQRPDEDDLLDYVTGRMPADRAAALDAAAAQDPALAAEIAVMRGSRAALATDPVAPPGALGWARLDRAIAAETPVARRRPVWLVASGTAAAAVALWQLVVVPRLPAPDAGGYVTATAPAEGTLLRVAFRATVTEAQIRGLLAETGGRITDGPSALGLWQIGFVSPAARDTALQRFSAASEIVESAQAD